MNLFLLWEPHFYNYVSWLWLFALVILSFRIKDLWLKRWMRYGTPVLIIVMERFFFYFARIEDGKILIARYHISVIGFIDDKVDSFFKLVVFEILLFAGVSLMILASFKIAQKLFYKLREK